MAEAERTVSARQLKVVHQSMLNRVIRIESEILASKGSASWLEDPPYSDQYKFRVRGTPRLVERWAEAVDRIIEYKPREKS